VVVVVVVDVVVDVVDVEVASRPAEVAVARGSE
jgi:hypothetical protein